MEPANSSKSSKCTGRIALEDARRLCSRAMKEYWMVDISDAIRTTTKTKTMVQISHKSDKVEAKTGNRLCRGRSIDWRKKIITTTRSVSIEYEKLKILTS